MVKGIGKGNAEGSLRALDENRAGTQFNSQTGRVAGELSGEIRAMAKEVWEWYFEGVRLRRLSRKKLKEITQDDQELARTQNSAARILNPKTEIEDREKIADRILGKPTQRVENEVSGDLNVSKPAIVFNDVEGASRKGEEERLQSEDEDI